LLEVAPGPTIANVSPLALRSAALAALTGLSALGCSAELETYSTDADTGSTHALITVQRSRSVDGVAERADALAGFLQVPADVESKPLYHLLGLKNPVPAVGQCRTRSARPEATPPLSRMGRVELLVVNEVSIGVAGSESVLAPHAFPTVTDSISGVVYTSRDRSPEAWPASARYAVHAVSTDAPPIDVESDAPSELEAVTVGGLPIADLAEISLHGPLDVTWGNGAPGDVVVVSLIASDGTTELSCSFRDEAGAGTVPASEFAGVGQGRLSLRRLHSQAFSAPGVDVGEVGFDFELGANVSFAP